MSTADDPRMWDEQYLTSMLNRVPESLILDYKRSTDLTKTDEKKNRSISKDVSSFANSDGGTLVYGMKEDNQYATDFDEGLNPDEITKEWLENVITSNVRPKLPDLFINEVSLTINRPGRVCYVVHIGKSDIAHQAADFKYYKRRQFKADPMYDYEIRDVNNRAKHPLIRLRFDCERSSRVNESIRFLLDIFATNDSPVRASEWKVEIWFPENTLSLDGDAIIKVKSGAQIKHPSIRLKEIPLLYTSIIFTDSIFPYDQRNFTAESRGQVGVLLPPIKLFDSRSEPHPFWIVWRVFADDAPAQWGEVDLLLVTAQERRRLRN